MFSKINAIKDAVKEAVKVGAQKYDQVKSDEKLQELKKQHTELMEIERDMEKTKESINRKYRWISQLRVDRTEIKERVEKLEFVNATKFIEERTKLEVVEASIQETESQIQTEEEKLQHSKKELAKKGLLYKKEMKLLKEKMVAEGYDPKLSVPEIKEEKTHHISRVQGLQYEKDLVPALNYLMDHLEEEVRITSYNQNTSVVKKDCEIAVKTSNYFLLLSKSEGYVEVGDERKEPYTIAKSIDFTIVDFDAVHLNVLVWDISDDEKDEVLEVFEGMYKDILAITDEKLNQKQAI